uniref:Uncharacterized protein n=1 Tax=Ditylenchus dipsaci TaxID=166011 RepID=A0A915EJ96_9BILA
MNTRYTERDVLMAKSNEVLYDKITKNIEEADLNNSLTEDAENVKKAEAVLAENGSKLPYLQNMLNETRAIRLMLHRISKFFDSQKENLSNTNKKLGRAIREELKKIYETLESAAQTSHSTVSAIKGTAPTQSK